MALVDDIRQSILDWEFPPGTHLSEGKLAEVYGVSRTPIRDALRKLASEDIVRFYPGRGAFVAEISVPDLMEMFQMRVALEPLCAELATRAVSRQAPHCLESLREDVEKSRESLLSGDTDFYFSVTSRLDAELARLASNHRLSDALRQVWNEVHRARRLIFGNEKRLLDSVGEHLAIIDAILSGDGDLAFKQTRDHVEKAHQAILTMAQGQYSEGFRDSAIDSGL